MYFTLKQSNTTFDDGRSDISPRPDLSFFIQSKNGVGDFIHIVDPENKFNIPNFGCPRFPSSRSQSLYYHRTTASKFCSSSSLLILPWCKHTLNCTNICTSTMRLRSATMTTTGKRSSPKKNRNFKMKFSPKKYHSPKKTVKDNKAKDREFLTVMSL